MANASINKYKIDKSFAEGIVVIDSMTDKFSGGVMFKDELYGCDEVVIKKYYSTSIDGCDYSSWKPINSYIELPDYVNIKFKYEIKSNPLKNVIELTSITIDGDKFEKEVCEIAKDDFSSTFGVKVNTCSPFDINSFDHFSLIEQGLNKFVNNSIGISVIYVSYDGESNIDTILKEYTSVDFNKKSCIKVVVEGNKLPDFKPQFSDWGIEFDSFTIFIEREIFRNLYGKNPAKHDIVIFPKYNRIYEVASANAQRGIGAKATFWEVALKKYEKSNNRESDLDVDSMIADALLPVDDIFSKDIESEAIEVVGSISHDKPYLDFDTIREIDKDVIISEESICPDGVTFANGYYWMKSCRPNLNDVMTYKDTVKTNDFGFLFSFNVHSFDTKKTPSTNFNRNHLKDESGMNHLCTIGEISLWVNETTISILDKTKLTTFILTNDIIFDEWYSIAINNSEYHNEFSIFLWNGGEILDDFLIKSTDIESQNINSSRFGLGNSDTKYTNIRVFKVQVPQEAQSMIFDTKYIANMDEKLVVGDDVVPNRVPLKMHADYKKPVKRG